LGLEFWFEEGLFKGAEGADQVTDCDAHHAEGFVFAGRAHGLNGAFEVHLAFLSSTSISLLSAVAAVVSDIVVFGAAFRSWPVTLVSSDVLEVTTRSS
jgi:hypothetical protein